MSPNKRIFLNIVATYGRSLFALVCGLFSARWVLEALGQEDFGLYGVVGGLVAFIGIVNSLLGCAVGRFYAVSVGAADSSSSVFCLLFPNVLLKLCRVHEELVYKRGCSGKCGTTSGGMRSCHISPNSLFSFELW